MRVIRAQGIDSCIKLLLHGDTISDASQYNRTVTQNATGLSASQVKFGSTSFYFDTAARTTGLTIPDSDDFHLGTKDFTIEAFVYTTVNNTTPQVVWSQANTSSYDPCCLQINSGYRFLLTSAGTGGPYIIDYIPFQPTLNKWQHVAVSRQGSTFRFFLDGVKATTDKTSTASIYNSTTVLAVGNTANRYNGYNVRGYVEEYCLTVGQAKYLADFTPPTMRFGGGICK